MARLEELWFGLRRHVPRLPRGPVALASEPPTRRVRSRVGVDVDARFSGRSVEHALE